MLEWMPSIFCRMLICSLLDQFVVVALSKWLVLLRNQTWEVVDVVHAHEYRINDVHLPIL